MSTTGRNVFAWAGSRITVQNAVMNDAGNDDVTVATPAAGKKVRLLSCALTLATSGTATFESNASTALSGAMALAAGEPLVLPFSESGWLESVAGEPLTIAHTQTLAGLATYAEVD